MIARIKALVAAVVARLKVWLAAARSRWPWLDHLVRAYGRYESQFGDRLAAAVAYFGFISFFPLLALAFAITGYVVTVYPPAREQLILAVQQSLPGLADQLPVRQLAGAKAGAGVIGLVGLLLTGTGWVDALRGALRTLWLRGPSGTNIIKQKLTDVVILLVLGVSLLASVAVTSVATSAGRAVLGLVGLHDSPAAGVVVRVLVIAVAVAVDTVLFLVVFARLGGSALPARRLWPGALFAAIGFEILKLVGTYLIGRVTSNPVYGVFAVVVGLIVWIDLVSRFTLFAAAWTATRDAELAQGEREGRDAQGEPAAAEE